MKWKNFVAVFVTAVINVFIFIGSAFFNVSKLDYVEGFSGLFFFLGILYCLYELYVKEDAEAGFFVSLGASCFLAGLINGVAMFCTGHIGGISQTYVNVASNIADLSRWVMFIGGAVLLVLATLRFGKNKVLPITMFGIAVVLFLAGNFCGKYLPQGWFEPLQWSCSMAFLLSAYLVSLYWYLRAKEKKRQRKYRRFCFFVVLTAMGFIYAVSGWLFSLIIGQNDFVTWHIFCYPIVIPLIVGVTGVIIKMCQVLRKDSLMVTVAKFGTKVVLFWLAVCGLGNICYIPVISPWLDEISEWNVFAGIFIIFGILALLAHFHDREMDMLMKISRGEK